MRLALDRALGTATLAVAALASGGLTAALVALTSPWAALAGMVGLVLLAALVWAPWASLPLVLVGGALGDKALDLKDVTQVTSLRMALIGLAVVALGARRLRGADWGPRVTTAVDGPAVVFASYVAVLAVLGLASGNDSHQVLVAAYQLLALPVYFFLATLTLNARARLWSAARLFCAGAAVLVVVGFAEGGRQGSLLSVLALLGLLALGGRAHATRAERLGLLALAPLFLVDVVLAGYRTVWVAAGVGGVVLILRLRGVRPAAVAIALVTALAGAAAVGLVGGPFADRADIALEQLHEPSGYRGAEAEVGRSMVAAAPLVGAGLGRVERDRYLETFGYADVGPVFHAFYLTAAVNSGLVGLLLIAVILWGAVRRAPPRGEGQREPALATATSAMLAGAVAAAAFAGPTDGHWELGLLPALACLFDAHATRP